MKNLKRSFLISFLAILLVYITNITSIPNSIILFQGEQLNLNTILGIQIEQKSDNYKVVQTFSNMESEVSSDTGKVDLSIKLGNVKVKDVTVNVIPKSVVVPVGNIIGLKLYTSGVLVVGMSEIEGIDKNKYKPYQNSGISEGDMIVQINKKEITCTNDLIEIVNNSKRGKFRNKICKRRRYKNNKCKSHKDK